MKTIINNIRVIDPASGRDEICDIVIDGERISGYSSSGIDADAVIDGSGLIAAPGLVDVHVHFRDPGQTHKEDIHTGSMAAVAGGYTSVVMMANTIPTIDNIDTLTDVLARGQKEKLHVYSCVNATKGMKGEEICDYKGLAAAGAAGITDDGKPIMDSKLLQEIFEEAAKLKLPVSLHEENPEFISENGVNAGEAAQLLGLKGSDRQAEIWMIDRDLQIANRTEVELNIQHISTKEGVELVRKAKMNNPRIHAEATPHHFSLTDDAVAIHGTLAKMNPPLRKEEDRQAIMAGLSDGTIDIIATDHAPHSVEEKSKPFSQAPSGIIGLETALSLAIMNLIDENVIDYRRLFELMSLNPAKLYGIEAGSLEPGARADIVIFDPQEEYIAGDYSSKSINSPFTGKKLKGKVKYTICNGIVVYKD